MTEPVRLWPCGSSFGVLGAVDTGDSLTLGIMGRLKLGVLLSTGRRDGDELPESVPVPDGVSILVRENQTIRHSRFKIPFFTAAKTSARSCSPPTMLRRVPEVLVLALPPRPW